MTPEQREELKQAAMKANGWASPASWDEDRNYSDYEVAGLDFNARANPAAILSLIAQVEALTVPQWIETSKRKPEEGQQVFICIVQPYTNAPTTYTVNIAYYERWDFRIDGYAVHTPSHWMPLNYPAAPTIPAIPGTKEGA